MNILYLHGLDSSLSVEKQSILEKYGAVYAPLIDYRKDTNSTETILSHYNDMHINAIVGSSMGGFVGYYIADACNGRRYFLTLPSPTVPCRRKFRILQTQTPS